MHLNTTRMALAMVVLLCSCGDPPDAAVNQDGATTPASQSPSAERVTAPPPEMAICEPDAPESPCPIVGRWRIAKVYDPTNTANPLADDRAMIGATLSVTGNGDGPGVLRWDGPDTGQFDISDRCIGPYLSPRGAPVSDPAALDTLQAALSAWSVAGDAHAARGLGCDQGQWTVPSNPSGDFYGVVLPLGDQAAIQWYEGRFLLLQRIG